MTGLIETRADGNPDKDGCTSCSSALNFEITDYFEVLKATDAFPSSPINLKLCQWKDVCTSERSAQ